MSFKWKTILGIAAIELVFLSFLVWQAATFIQELGETDIEKRAQDTVMLANNVLLNSLIAYDLATIDEQVQQLGALDSVSYVTLEGHGKQLSSSGQYPSPAPVPEASINEVADETYDIIHRFEIGGQTLGVLRIGFSLEQLYAVTFQAKARLYFIALAEILLVGLCSWLLARYLTNRILLLQNASKTLQLGQPVHPISNGGRDEISTTITAFNDMAYALGEREEALRLTNEQLEKANTILKERENEIWSLFNAAPDGIAVLDNEGNISFANRQLLKLLGTGEASVIGRSLNEFLTTGEVGMLAEFASGQDGKSRTHRHWVQNHAGRNLFVEVNTGLFRSTDASRTIAIIRDKTHEQNLKRAAKLHEQLKTNLVDSSLDALVTINGDGKVIDYSQSAESLFGWVKADILGQFVEDYLIPSELRSAHQKGMAHFLVTGHGPLIGKRVETSACRKDGTTFPVELALHATWFDGEAFVTASIRDITERKQKEEELLRAKEAADEASMAKSRFLSYMSHEIRSPMNAVLGSLALIQERGHFEPSEQYYLDLARHSGDALLQVVNEVLDFSKIEAGHVQFRREPCALRELVRGVQSAILAKGVKPGVALYIDFEDSVPTDIITDGEHLRQILTILLDNAYKFTKEGEISVVVREVTSTQDTSARHLRIAVKDTGPGVPPELAETIFSEFEQIDATRDSGYGGTGLGLAIAKRLVTGLGGKIWLESVIHVGSTFLFEIPFDSVDEVLPAPEQQGDSCLNDVEQKAACTPIAQILLVDDVEANLVIGAGLLRNRGYVVDLARDGVEAVKQAEETAYAVILMDIRMPRLNGLDATLKIRSSRGKNANTPIIALTANAEKSELDRCLEAGMNDFVSKPFNIERLSGVIERCLSDHTQEEKAMTGQVDSGIKGSELLSDEVLAQLSKDTSVEALPMMISVFTNEVKKRLEGIERAQNAADELEIREQAHALKSCAGTFGGLRLQAAARDLEDLASHSSACGEGKALNTVKQVAEETLVAYSDYRNHLQTSSTRVD
jgi:PAS domain S-box-containing protein